MNGRQEEERGFTVVVERIEQHYKLMGEKVDLLNQKMDRTVKELERKDHELGSKITLSVRTILERIDLRFAEVKKELNVLTSRIDAHERAHAD